EVDGAERIDAGREGRVGVAAARHVGTDGSAAHLVGYSIRTVDVAVDAAHAHSLGRQTDGGGVADPGRGARHERHAPLEFHVAGRYGARTTSTRPAAGNGCGVRPRQDSNLRTRLRRPMLYPLSYEGSP